MLIKCLQGKLPWTGLEPDQMLEMKTELSYEVRNNYVRENFFLSKMLNFFLPFQQTVGDICTKTLVKFLKHARRLTFIENPNFPYLKGLLIEELKKHGHVADMQFDWSVTKSKSSGRGSRSGSMKSLISKLWKNL